MNTVNIPTFLNIDLQFTLSPLSRRFGAYGIDWLIKLSYIFLITYFIRVDIFSPSYQLLSFFLYLPVYFYSLLFEWLWNGQTLGKKLMGIKVIAENGSSPSFSQCATRWLFLLADVYFFILLSSAIQWMMVFAVFSPLVGIILISSSKTQQRLGDMAAGTFIIKVEEDYAGIEETIYAYSNKKEDYTPKYPQIIKLSDKDITVIKNLLERSVENYDEELARKLASHLKNILDIETKDKDPVFLKDLLSDYNHLAIKSNT
jgi:uncharacterized RDD family membrane protein YckC